MCWRNFLLVLGLTGTLWMQSHDASAKDVPIIGFLSGASPEPFAHLVEAFREGLARSGFVEGENVAVEFRWARGNYDLLAGLAAELVEANVDALASSGGDRPTLALQAATKDIPIVFFGSDDPVRFGLVESLARPGQNITGATLFTSEVEIKKLELLHDVLPDATAIGVLVNPGNPTSATDSQVIADAASDLGFELFLQGAASEAEIAAAFDAFATQALDGILIGHDPYFNNQREQIVMLVDRLGLPAVYEHRAFIEAGGLMSYGNVIEDNYRIGGEYIGRILKGEKPADLPVRQASTFEIVINQAAADRLGLTIPQSVLVRADDILE